MHPRGLLPLLAALLAGPAAAQPEPERTLASFGDWVVRCERAGPRRSCEMVQATLDTRQQPVAVLALGRADRDAPYRLVAQVPVSVAVAEPARLTLEPPLPLPFRSCTPRGCFAEAAVADTAALARLRERGAEAPARLEWRDATGAEVAIPVSFRGFADAFSALLREGE